MDGPPFETLRSHPVPFHQQLFRNQWIPADFLQRLQICCVRPTFEDPRSERGKLFGIRDDYPDKVRLQTVSVDENLHDERDAGVDVLNFLQGNVLALREFHYILT